MTWLAHYLRQNKVVGSFLLFLENPWHLLFAALLAAITTTKSNFNS
jgi:hypothetical protein